MKLRFAAFGLLIAAIILAATASLSLAKKFYRRQLEAQVWPAGLPAPPALGGAAEASAPVLLLLGDSRLAQWPRPARSACRWVNAGVTGLTAAQLELRAPALLRQYRPKFVVIEAGVNDLKLLGLRPELAPELVAQTLGHLTAIARLAAESGATVYLLETWPATQPDLLRRLVWSPAIERAIDELNDRLRQQSGVVILDLFQEAGLPLEPARYRDTLHFTPETYARLTPALERRLALP